MNWLGLLSGLVSLFNKVSGIWKNRQLMKAGEAKAKLEQLEEENRASKRAKKRKARIDRLSDADIHKRMRKYRRGFNKRV